ncbi:MAG: RNA methyltransferase [Deltaproteobacteria bacterium]|nr:RNA methyltransferase [Deltaproteobacteria bacterium]
MRRRHLQDSGPAAQGAIDNISIVLVEPQSPGNVGSVARAMKNTGFSDLVLINPCDYRNNEAYSFACKADDVLLGARRFPDLVLTLAEGVPKIVELASRNSVSILFGREDRGLTNEEIPLCDMLLEIPAHPDYPSFNLSQAVMLVCHHIFTFGGDRGPVIKTAPRQELEKMYAHLEETLRKLDYGEKGGEHLLESILRSFRRLFGRTGLMQKEINMLRGIFTQIEDRTPKK